MKGIRSMILQMIAVAFLLSSSEAARASELTQAIAIQKARHFSEGFLNLLALWHNGEWIRAPFTPVAVLSYPEGVNYHELLTTHRYLLNPAVMAVEHPAHFEDYIPQPFYNYPVFFQYTATQYTAYEHLLGRRFVHYADGRAGFECQSFYARNVMGIIDLKDLCLYGVFAEPETEKAARENHEGASKSSRLQGKVFVTGGPVGAAVEEVNGLPGLEKWLDRGAGKMVAFFKDQHEAALEEKKRDLRFSPEEALRIVDETHEVEALPVVGVGFPDPALYATQAAITRFSLSDIFSGAFIYVTYAYPHDACPEDVVSWTGNYMLIVDLRDGGVDAPVWETCTPYDPGSGQFEGTRYQFQAICDVNENGAPEIILDFGGHEHWGIQVLELVDGKLSLIATYGG